MMVQKLTVTTQMVVVVLILLVRSANHINVGTGKELTIQNFLNWWLRL